MQWWSDDPEKESSSIIAFTAEHDEQVLQALHLISQVKCSHFTLLTNNFRRKMTVPNQEYNSYFQHFLFVEMIEEFFCLVSLKDFSIWSCIGIQYLVIRFTVTICFSSIDNALILFCFLFSRVGESTVGGGNRGLCGSGSGCPTKEDNAMASNKLKTEDEKAFLNYTGLPRGLYNEVLQRIKAG